MAASPDLEAPVAPAEGSSWGIGLSGRVVVTLTVTGGLLFGGFWVAWLTLAGRIASGDLILASTERFVVGAALGLVHGLVLGYHGREKGISKRWTVWAEVRAAIFALPALALAWPVAGWIGSTESTRLGGAAGSIVLTVVAWLAGLIMVVTTVALLVRAFRLAYFRWPNRRSGTPLVGAVLVATLLLAFDVQPDLWGLRLRYTDVTLAIMGLIATIWVTAPIITLALRFSRGTVLRPPLAWGHSPTAITSNVALAGAVGIALAPLARGFYQGPYLLPNVATDRSLPRALLATVGHATLDEIVLRLVPILLVAFLLTKGRPRRGVGIATAAVLAATLVQIAVSAAGVSSIGFRATATVWTYVAQVVALPALVFGVLLWWRGLGTAWLAHVVWLLAAAWMSTGIS